MGCEEKNVLHMYLLPNSRGAILNISLNAFVKGLWATDFNSI